MEKPRCILLFENALKSQHTRADYLRNLINFQNFCGVPTLESLLEIEPKKLQDLVMD